MNFEKLSDENFLIYCAKYYDNPQCHSTEEFIEDLKRIKYIKKLITRYNETGELKERLILNHLTILCNVFGPDHLNRILYLKMKPQFKYIKPFLVLLNILQPRIFEVKNEKTIDTDTIEMDDGVIKVLRSINDEC
jgi:hypothetical protein